MDAFRIKYLLFAASYFLLFAALCPPADWGFFAHRRINRLAIFTLPPQMIAFYKKNIEYLTAHATDPDMRRYVVPTEGIRHFIDLDYWEKLPRNFVDTRRIFAEAVIINKANDTLKIFGKNVKKLNEWNIVLKGQNFPVFFDRDSLVMLKEDYEKFFYEQIYHFQYNDKWDLDCDSLTSFFAFHGFKLDCQRAYAVDTFVQHGVLPYHLARMQRNLTDAMQLGNVDQILRLSADFGHYISDAHVPLHTHSNYNGQKTDQIGIHAFWETRLPELFADDTYDYFVGKASYIDDPVEHYWKIVEKSHSLVEEVLDIEKNISQTFPEDQQDCFVERGAGYIQKMPCEKYAKLYHEKLNGQVEDQLRTAIQRVGSAWYTAWVDAGQPDLLKLIDNRQIEKEMEAERALIKAVERGEILGREH